MATEPSNGGGGGPPDPGGQSSGQTGRGGNNNNNYRGNRPRGARGGGDREGGRENQNQNRERNPNQNQRGGGGGGGGKRTRGGGRGGTGRNNNEANRGEGNRAGEAHLSTTEQAARFKEQQVEMAKVREEKRKAERAANGGGEGGEGEGEDGEEGEEGETCWICASEIVHESVAPCNHRTCHICALRMRGLYKDYNCATCRTPAPFVIFTNDKSKKYEEFTPADIKASDDNIGIRYDDVDIQDDTVLLLRFNCPDDSCDAVCLGWGGRNGIHRHVQSVHHMKVCDLCSRFKKVFTHEHVLYTDAELRKHVAVGDDNPGAVDQSGFKGHPRCSFCQINFYGDDELYIHCREDHERCFICDRQTGGKPQYFANYNTLSIHYREDHFVCGEPACLEQKFVVFATELDLKAHQLAEHGNTLSKDIRRDVQTVNLSDFNIREPFSGMAHGYGREGRSRGRGRDPNAEPIPGSSAQPLRRDELAFQRQMAIHSAQSVTSRTFGGQLTAPTPAQSRPSQPSQQPPSMTVSRPSPAVEAATTSIANLNLETPSTSLTPQEQARQLRNRAVVERATVLLQNDPLKMTQFRNSISSYKKGEMTAQALVNLFFVLFQDIPSNALGTLIREIADLYEDSTKGDQLRESWYNWRAINEDYPSLPQTRASTSSSIPLNWAVTSSSSSSNINNSNGNGNGNSKSNRVLKLKKSTAQSNKSSLNQAKSWGRGSSNNQQPGTAGMNVSTPGDFFPGLPSASKPTASVKSNAFDGVYASAGSGAGVGGSSRGGSNPGSAGNSRPVSRVIGGGGGGGRGSVLGGGSEAFPALPKASKPQSTIMSYGNGRMVRRDVGNAPVGASPWSGGGGSGAGSEVGGDGVEEGDGEEGGKGKKGKKGKGKKVLLNWAA